MACLFPVGSGGGVVLACVSTLVCAGGTVVLSCLSPLPVCGAFKWACFSPVCVGEAVNVSCVVGLSLLCFEELSC